MLTLFNQRESARSDSPLSDPRDSVWRKMKRPFWSLAGLVAAALLLNIATFVPAYAQLQASGGSVVTISGALPAGSNVIGHVVVDTAPTTAVTGTFWQATQPVSGTVTVNTLPSGTNLIGYTRAQNSCGTTNYESVMSNPPTSPTQLTATTTCVSMVYVSNTTGSAATFTLADQGTGCNSAACTFVSAFSMPANSNMMLPLGGAKFASGIKWSQGTTNALSVDIIGNQ